jgi:glutamate racemase
VYRLQYRLDDWAGHGTRSARSDTRLLRHGAPGLVEAAEAMLRGEPADGAAVEAAVEGLRRQPGGDLIDTVVLACTHFPLLETDLARAFGTDVRFVHGASGIARRIASLTDGQKFLRTAPDFAIFTSDKDRFADYAPALARYGLGRSEMF